MPRTFIRRLKHDGGVNASLFEQTAQDRRRQAARGGCTSPGLIGEASDECVAHPTHGGVMNAGRIPAEQCLAKGIFVFHGIVGERANLAA
jgi:hypothetical protein